MAERTIYALKTERDHIDRLHEIANLAKIGAAATETILDLEHMGSAQLTLLEMIYTLASEGVEIAELAADRT